MMPALVFGAGKLSLLYYDFREDVSGIFEKFVDETPIIAAPASNLRHTMDVWLAQANPADSAVVHGASVVGICVRRRAGIHHA